jgi:hypothetical protein
MKLRFAVSSAAILLMLSTSLWAESTTCISPTYIVPDGRSVESHFAANRYWFAFYGMAGHSYVLEYGAFHSNNSGISVSPTIYAPVDSPCTGAPSTLAVTTTTYVDPYMGDGNSSRRRSWIAPINGNYFISLASSGSDLVSYRVVDTTLYASTWTTVSNYQTQLAFKNTTASIVSCKLTLNITYPSSSTVIRIVILPAGGSRRMTVGLHGDVRQSGTAGDATLACNGAPGSVIANAYLVRGESTALTALTFAHRDSQH